MLRDYIVTILYSVSKVSHCETVQIGIGIRMYIYLQSKNINY